MFTKEPFQFMLLWSEFLKLKLWNRLRSFFVANFNFIYLIYVSITLALLSAASNYLLNFSNFLSISLFFSRTSLSLVYCAYCWSLILSLINFLISTRFFFIYFISSLSARFAAPFWRPARDSTTSLIFEKEFKVETLKFDRSCCVAFCSFSKSANSILSNQILRWNWPKSFINLSMTWKF